jgi:hypothetical protein
LSQSRSLPAKLTPPLLIKQQDTAVRRATTVAVGVVVQELDDRFPPVPVLEALSVVYPKYWVDKPKPTDVRAKTSALKVVYCKMSTGAAGAVGPILDADELDRKFSIFCDTMEVTTTAMQDEMVLAGAATGRTGYLREAGAVCSC